jgi:hypothetical protein
MAASYLTSNKSTVDSQNAGIEIGFVDLLDRNGTVVASWGVHSPRCTIGSDLEASVRVPEGNLAPNHVLLIFGKKFTLLKALAQPTRVSGRPVKEWLIDTSTTIEIGELTFVVHPFPSRPLSSVVRGERISEIASRMGAAASEALDVSVHEPPSNSTIPIVEPYVVFPESVGQTIAHSTPVNSDKSASEAAPEVLGQIKENMESLTAAFAALQANSVQRQLDVQANTESVVLASTQKMMEGFADRWFSDIRRELGTFGSQQQESVSQLTQSLDSRLNSMEQRIETIGVTSSEEIRVLSNQLSSLANDQTELRNSLSEARSSQSETQSHSRSQATATPGSSEATIREREILPHSEAPSYSPSYSPSFESNPTPDAISPTLENRPNTNRHARMDGSERAGETSGDFSGQSLPYYAANMPDPQFPAEPELGPMYPSAGEADSPYQQAPHAMQWDAPVDDSSDQSYVELLRRLEKNQTEVEKRSESLLAPELPPVESLDESTTAPSREIPWHSQGNSVLQNSVLHDGAPGVGFSESSISKVETAGPPAASPGASGTPMLGESAEDLEHLRSLSANHNLEPESVDLRQLQVGLDSDAISSRLERLLSEATDRRKTPQATENPFDRLQPRTSEVSEDAIRPIASKLESRVGRSPMVEQLLRPSTEIPAEVSSDDDAMDSGERELQALYASLGLSRIPAKGAQAHGYNEAVNPDVAAEGSYDQIEAQRVPMRGGGHEAVVPPPYPEKGDDDVLPHGADEDPLGVSDRLVERSPLQKPSNYEELGELQVQNGASALSSSQNADGGQSESSDDQNAEDESIEDYMQRLLQRVRSGPNSSPVAVSGNNLKSSLPSISKRVTELPELSAEIALPIPSPSGQELSPASTPLSRPFSSLPPRAANRAPEAKADLDALRELANSNARRAIKRSDKRRNNNDFLVNVVVCVFSLACGLALLVMNGFRINVTFLGMTTAFLVSILWGVDSVRTYLTMLREQKDGIPNRDEARE